MSPVELEREARFERIVLDELNDAPQHAFEIAHSSGQEERPIREAVERLLAGGNITTRPYDNRFIRVKSRPGASGIKAATIDQLNGRQK